MSLVTIDEVNMHLRYDGDDNDELLNQYIDAADAVIKKHVDATNWDESNVAFKQAALLLIGYWDESRNAQNDDAYEWFLPKPVLALLTPYRTPTVV